MGIRYASDTARANASSVIAVILGISAAVGMLALGGELVGADSLDIVITSYLFSWPLFAAIYLGWTHWAYGGSGPRALVARARREHERQRRWWNVVLGYGGASNWTLTAAIVAVFLTVLIAQDPGHRSDAVYVILGLLCVAGSWAFMVYAFALEYLRLDSGPDDDTRHIEMEVGGHPQFGDYLTLAVLLSTMRRPSRRRSAPATPGGSCASTCCSRSPSTR